MGVCDKQNDSRWGPGEPAPEKYKEGSTQNEQITSNNEHISAEQSYNAGKDQGITVAVGEQNGFTRRVTLVPHQHTHVHRKRGEKEERQRLAVRTFILSRKYTLKEFRQHTSENAGVMKAKLTAQEQHAFTRRVHAPAQH